MTARGHAGFTEEAGLRAGHCSISQGHHGFLHDGFGRKQTDHFM
jgi:hypothetical protein